MDGLNILPKIKPINAPETTFNAPGAFFPANSHSRAPHPEKTSK